MKLPARKKYPQKITIDNEEWAIVFKPKLKLRGQSIWGLTDPAKRTIYIHAKADREMRMVTFIHEVLHALSFERGFKLTHKQINPLEKAIYRFLVDNF